MAGKQHDLIVIGAGPGGYVAAIRGAQLGLDVACIELEERLGGTCLRVGCIPSKALLESSERYYAARHDGAAHGMKFSGLELDLEAMMQRKEGIVDQLTKGVAHLFKKNGVTRYEGRGRLDGPGRVVVDGADGLVELTGNHIIIATGSRSAGLPGVELDYDRIGTSTEALSYPAVPGHLVVIGAGYIGLELASLWRRLGAEVTVLEYLERILPGTDDEIQREAQRVLKKQGLKIKVGVRVTGARVENGQCVVEYEGGEPLACDRVLLAVGRVPNTQGLNLESVGIETDKRGCIPVGDGYRTAAEGVYAIGDVIAGPMLAHKASEEGVAAVERIATGTGHVNYDAIPGVAYTEPEIASVGKTEDALLEQGAEYKKGVFLFRANGRAKALGQLDGKVKVLADAETGRVLGVHIIGPRAGDLIAECVLAVELGATADDVARACHAHPTLAEAVKEAALDVDGRAVHA